MFELVTIEDIIRIPPSLFDRDLEEAALEVLRNEYEGITDPDLGKVISVVDILDVGIGKLIPGDGASYHSVKFTVVAFKPKVNEIVEGIVVEVVDFGIFVRVGPIDGLCHISQVADDFFSYDSKNAVLIGKTKGYKIQVDDVVRARIVAVSMSGPDKTGKFALSMRHPYLGKLEWIRAQIQQELQSEEVKEKATKKEGE